MEIILKKNVDNLGYKDDIVEVKPGYALNFLIPQGYGIIANKSTKKAHEEVLRQRSHKEVKVKEEAQEIAKKIEATSIKIGAKVGENGRIFGSVNTIQLSEALKAEGVDVDRKSLKIVEEPIKEVGTYTGLANLHKEVSAEFKFEVIEE
ncbi:50S ribosomal protein L9 [Brumimicrobium aurantiacum]|uniref:Large ribosomal subunit protein bL9 n=1 Tax=Brumimicrobium aurantiacum TaxID=1737063 RepID=A0A3E1F0Z5_9FLAO|nr:50S ribosomal protein L9 [Brumimicrobium aurantiacum]RFC55419.1 50S ribosomal protein L9 [Brumimicrobium aurantiacum]